MERSYDNLAGVKKIFIALALLFSVSAFSECFAQTVRATNVHGQPVQSAVIDDASSGDNTIVAAVSGKKICVLGFGFIVAGAVNVRFEDGAGGTALTGVMTFDAASKGIAVPIGMDCLFQTSDGTLLNLELSGAVSVDGWVNYVVID